VGTPHDLVEAADKALYSSKEAGRNRLTHIDDLHMPDPAGDLLAESAQPYAHMIQELMLLQQAAPATRAEMLAIMTEMGDATIQGWAHLLDGRDQEAAGHTERVTEMMIRLAHMVGMNPEEVTCARWGALLHDIGTVGIPDQILHKEGALTEEEWSVIRRHPTIAYEMLASAPFLRPTLDIPYCHHERWDGTGYPRGLAGNDIPLTARLFAVIDVYDALTNDRPYRRAWSKRKAVAHLKALAGTHFDPRAVRMFLAMLNDQGPTPSTQLELPV
jgi:HD-GYP domain-containing protein (c-di-GMP phosphodiesterase class II)